jgi:hypothetical protein
MNIAPGGTLCQRFFEISPCAGHGSFHEAAIGQPAGESLESRHEVLDEAQEGGRKGG